MDLMTMMTTRFAFTLGKPTLFAVIANQNTHLIAHEPTQKVDISLGD
jgi:hypothetical protein